MSMGKRKAQELARTEAISFGQLRQMIDRARDRGGVSTVNRGILLARALDIYLGAIADRPDDEVPMAWRSSPYSPSGKKVPSRDFLIVCNILRDAG